MKKMRWCIKDLIDLEYFLGSDEGDGDESARISLIDQDRAIYLEHIQPLEDDGQSLSRGRTIRAWLERRKEMEKSESGPGSPAAARGSASRGAGTRAPGRAGWPALP